MQKHLKLSFILFVTFSILLLNSCTKDKRRTDDLRQTTQLNENIAGWLNSKKAETLPERNAKINELIAALDYQNSWNETVSTSEHFVVIPVGRQYKPQNAIDKPYYTYLLLSLSSDETIKKGAIVQYVPESAGQGGVPKATFANIFSSRNIGSSGQFVISTIAGRYKYDLTFKNGQLTELREISKGKKIASVETSTERSGECWNFYLTTTTRYEDGTTETETTYLGTQCFQCGDINPWGQTVACTEIDPGDGSTGGGDTFEYEEERVKGANYTWTVQNIPSEFGGGWISETCRLVAKFNNRNADKNRFLGRANYGSNINLYWNSWGENGTVGWSNTTFSYTINSNTNLTITAAGSIRFFVNDRIFNYSGAKSVLLSEPSWED